MGTEKDTVFWQDDKSVSGASIVGFMKLYSDKTAIKLKSKALIAYPVHAVFFNFSLCWRSWLINKGRTVVRILLVGNVDCVERFVGDDVTSIHGFTSGFTVEMESFFLLTSDASGRLQKMEMLHETEKMLLELLNCYVLSGFLLHGRTG